MISIFTAMWDWPRYLNWTFQLAVEAVCRCWLTACRVLGGCVPSRAAALSLLGTLQVMKLEGFKNFNCVRESDPKFDRYIDEMCRGNTHLLNIHYLRVGKQAPILAVEALRYRKKP